VAVGNSAAIAVNVPIGPPAIRAGVISAGDVPLGEGVGLGAGA